VSTWVRTNVSRRSYRPGCSWRDVDGRVGQYDRVFIVRATRKLLDVVGPPNVSARDQDATVLGEWYATRLPWRTRVALLVSESTLLPVLMPLTPAASWLSRIAPHVATVLAGHAAPPAFIDAEVQAMQDPRVGPTASRRIVGVMNEFVHLAEVHRAHHPDPDFLALSMRLSTTPCSPLYQRNGSPDRELAAVLRAYRQPSGPATPGQRHPD
jgi:hypothetical protein